MKFARRFFGQVSPAPTLVCTPTTFVAKSVKPQLERATGFEPATTGSEVPCSSPELRPLIWSGRPDLNRGPRDPNSRALTKLRYAPTECAKLIMPQLLSFGLDSF